jgi:hypothetical protein
MSPLAGLFHCETLIPALFALGHIMAALTGLAARTPIRYRICGTEYLVMDLCIGSQLPPEFPQNLPQQAFQVVGRRLKGIRIHCQWRTEYQMKDPVFW